MSGSLTRPDFTADIKDLARRLDALERRTTPKPAVGNSGFGADPAHYVGCFAWWQQAVVVISDDGYVNTAVDFVEGDLLFSVTDPSGTPFWTIDSGSIDLLPGAYDVVLSLTVTPPTGSTGTIISYDGGGLNYGYHIVPASRVENLTTIVLTSWRSISTNHGINLFGSQPNLPIDVRVGHNMGATVTMYVTVAVWKIGHVDT